MLSDSFIVLSVLDGLCLPVFFLLLNDFSWNVDKNGDVEGTADDDTTGETEIVRNERKVTCYQINILEGFKYFNHITCLKLW